MILDEPELTNYERMVAAAAIVDRGQTVFVWVQHRLKDEHCYVNWVAAILRAPGHDTIDADILAGGVSIIFEKDT